jgi:uncharacterized membrane protein YdfJ with MMPL/SSD domain
MDASPGGGDRVLHGLAALAITHPRKVIAVWVLAATIGLALASGLAGELSDRGFSVPGSQSERLERVMKEAIPGHRGTELFVLVTKPLNARDDPVRLVQRALRPFPGILSVTRTGASVEGSEDAARAVERQVVTFRIDAKSSEAEQYVPRFRAALERSARGPIKAGLFGGVAVSERYSTIARADLTRAERIAFPFVLIVLLVAFVSVLAAALPLVSAFVGLVVTFAGLYAIGRSAGLSVFVTNTASVLALGLSIDFALFMVTRFREELSLAPSREEAIQCVLGSTGRAVVLSGATIMTSLSALFLVGVELFSSMAVGAILAAAVSVAVALTLIPAVLVLLGERINSLRLGVVARAAQRATFWHRLADVVTTRPVASAATATALLCIAALPASGIHTTVRLLDSLPQHDPVRQEANSINRAFHPGSSGPLQLVTRGDLPAALWRDPAVAQTWAETHGKHGWFAIQVILKERPETASAHNAVVRLRDLFKKTGRTTYIGGLPAASSDLLKRIDERTPWVLGITVFLGACLLGAGLRSIVIPIKAMAGTLLSVAATMGILARLFPSAGGGSDLEFFVPLLLFVIVFGLSVDYEVFLLSRIREAVRAGETTSAAVRTGLTRSARSITLAGISLAAVFLALATSALPAFQELGIGVAVAIVIDITVVRCVLVPASVVLLGRWNWWLPWSAQPQRA